MLRRTPIKRGSGFKRPHREKTPQPVYAPTGRAGVYGGSTNCADPKTVELRNPRLLRMARGKECLLQVPGVCNGDRSTTVACHSNLAEHGKSGARKADDQNSVHGCGACHSWLDQGPASYEEKRAVFLLALRRQTQVWRIMVADTSVPAADRDAATWALRYLVGITG